MLKNILFMGASTFARLLSGAVLFFILARLLGPAEYGVLVYHFSVTMMLTLFVEYGYTTYLVKRGGEEPNHIPKIMQEALVTKVALLLFYILICVLMLVFGFIQSSNGLLFLLLATAAIFMSFGDFYNVPFRGIQKFQKESRNVILASLIHFAIVTPLVFLSRSVIDVACGFVFSRFIFLVISACSYKKEFGTYAWDKSLMFKWAIIKSNLKSCFSYAADNGLVNVRSYMDVLIINWTLGSSAVGLYQAGMNVVKAIENLAPIFANVYLPKLSSLKNNLAECNRHYMNLVYMMFFSGLALLLGFCFVSEDMIVLVLGESYAETTHLFPLFGVFLFTRFMTISQGVVATALGLQRYRMYAGIISLLLLTGSSFYLLKLFGLQGAVMANIFVTMFLLLYFSGLLRLKKFHLSAGIYPMALFSMAMACLTMFFYKV